VINLVSTRGLKNRTIFSSTLKTELSEKFKELSDQTRITQSKLLDEAIEDLLAKYEKKGVN
jgi:predicted DNA-binding protein